MHEFWGQQILCNMSGICDMDLNDTDYLVNLLKKSITTAGATLVEITYHNFLPEGITIIAILKESHVAIHTYPEHDALFFDAFTCGRKAKPEMIAQFFLDTIKPPKYTFKVLIRSTNEIREKSF